MDAWCVFLRLCSGGCILRVRESLMRPQIAAFCVCAIASGAMFWRWRRMTLEWRRQVWLLYGWFTALMCFGSCIGAISWTANMFLRIFFITAYSEETNPQQIDPAVAREIALNFGRAARWNAAFFVLSPVALLTEIVVKLIILDRLLDLAAHGHQDGPSLRRRLAVGQKLLLATVVALNVVSFGGGISSAAAQIPISQLCDDAAAAVENGNIFLALQYAEQVKKQQQSDFQKASIQEFSEVYPSRSPSVKL